MLTAPKACMTGLAQYRDKVYDTRAIFLDCGSKPCRNDNRYPVALLSQEYPNFSISYPKISSR